MSLILDGHLRIREYTFHFDTGYTYYTLTMLPHLPLETSHIVARHPLSQPASFDPLVPLDYWSWILSIIVFSFMALLIFLSHISLRPTPGSLLSSLYYCTDFWKDLNWFKTSSLLLCLWAISFFLINNAYQIDFRTGLINQNLENPVNNWDDVNMFNVHIFTFEFAKLKPVSLRGFITLENLLEFDRFHYRYDYRSLIKRLVKILFII